MKMTQSDIRYYNNPGGPTIGVTVKPVIRNHLYLKGHGNPPSLILRQNPKPGELARWINQLNLVAESTKHALPVMVISNSRNEHGEVVFGMNDAAGVFAACIREEWDSMGLKKGYMYMPGVVTTIFDSIYSKST